MTSFGEERAVVSAIVCSYFCFCLKAFPPPLGACVIYFNVPLPGPSI